MKLNEEQKKLVEDNIALVKYSMVLVNINPLEFDDYIDIGYIKLCEIAQSFDPNKNTKFSTYAISCLTNEFKKNFRIRTFKKRNGKSIVSLYDNINDVEDITYEEVIEDDSNNILDFIENHTYKDFENNLIKLFKNDNYAISIINMLMNGKSQTDISNEFNISPQAVNDKLQKIRLIIKRNLYRL